MEETIAQIQKIDMLVLGDDFFIPTYNRLFIPLTMTDNEIARTATTDLAKDLQKISKDFNTSFENALKARGLK